MKLNINTSVDPNFIYPFKKSKFVPKNDKCLLIMGQTEERIKEYISQFPDKPVPGGFAAYWGIPEFEGITSSFKNETGSSQNHQWLVDQFPNTAIHSALWIVGMDNIDQKTIDGKYDKIILQFANWAKSINRPIYLRIGYEFDGAHNQLEPHKYVKLYKKIVDMLRKEGADNIAYVWHSYAAPPYQNHLINSWYPGDDYVDWIAISVFGHGYNDVDFGDCANNVLALAREHHKPVMIAESNPINGIYSNDAESWIDWFTNFFIFVYQKNIKAISFINEDWQSLEIPGISEWKDGKLWNDPKASQAWFEETNKNKYLKQSSFLFKELDYQ